MVPHDVIEVSVFFVALFILTPLLGIYMAKVLSREHHCQEMNWREYAMAILWLSLIGTAFTVAAQMLQTKPVSWDLALNTAISFVTNTNWQAYAGETTLSYWVQMIALTTQNFMSAAMGMAVLLVLIRGLTRKNTHELGNFWVDMTRIIVWILLPMSFVFAIILVTQGVIQDWETGAVASQVAIKQLGTNGGGFFGANSAHPFENPTPLSNFLQMLAILLIPSALIYTFGIMTKARAHARLLYGVTIVLFMACFVGMLWAEQQKNPALELTQQLEGKELRFGVVSSTLWAAATTAASNGSVNAMHDSFSPVAGGIAMFQMLIGEIIFGGLGSGLYGLLLFVMLTVFLAGLMVGRTPEYLGKKLETREMKLVLLAIILPGATVLVGAGACVLWPFAIQQLSNHGPHGLSEILYAWASTTNNNGSAFAGFNTSSIAFNLIFSVAMLIGRYGVILPILAMADSFSSKKSVPTTSSTFETDTLIFAVLLIAVILIIGALTFLPALSLGPILEHFAMNRLQTY